MNEYQENLITYSLLCFGCYCLCLPGIYHSSQDLMASLSLINPKLFAELISSIVGLGIALFLYRLVFLTDN